MYERVFGAKRVAIVTLVAVILCVGILATVHVVSNGSGEDSSEQTAATDERDWRDDFTVQYRHIEESKFDDPLDEINALFNGTFVFEQDEYAITNKTNHIMESVELIFRVDMAGYEPFEFDQYVGTMKQGETKVETLLVERIRYEMEEKGYNDPSDDEYFDLLVFDACQLVRIEYKVKE